MLDSQIVDVKGLYANLSALAKDQQKPTADLLDALHQILGVPLQAIIETTQAFSEQALSPRQQKELLTKIQYLSNECVNILNNLLELSQQAQQQIEPSAENEVSADLDLLQGVPTLLIDDDQGRRQLFQAQLSSLGLSCQAVNLDEALPTLQQAAHNKSPFQMAIVCGERFDHQAAYLGRTIKANVFYQNIMPVLALASHKPFDFEIERAHFSGFNCVLDQTQIGPFAQKLATAWRSWPGRIQVKENPVELKQRHILLVEDEPIAQFSTQRQLNALGFAVDVAADGQKALRLLINNKYDLIFMDIGLPDISGLEVTAEFRKRQAGQTRTPIIGLTVYALEEDEKQGLAVGMDAYLVKPLLQNKLQEVLEKWVKD